MSAGEFLGGLTMMNDPIQILAEIQRHGGALWGEGGRLRGRVPETLCHLQPDIQAKKEDLLDLVKDRPAVPVGVRIMCWSPITSPFRLNRYTVVTNTSAFIHATMRQLEQRLAGNNSLAGNWSLSDLIERLELAGVQVACGEGTRSDEASYDSCEEDS